MAKDFSDFSMAFWRARRSRSSNAADYLTLGYKALEYGDYESAVECALQVVLLSKSAHRNFQAKMMDSAQLLAFQAEAMQPGAVRCLRTLQIA